MQIKFISLSLKKTNKHSFQCVFGTVKHLIIYRECVVEGNKEVQDKEDKVCLTLPVATMSFGYLCRQFGEVDSVSDRAILVL